jgi:uncharacterized protein
MTESNLPDRGVQADPVKPSRFNILIRESGCEYLINSLSTAVLELSTPWLRRLGHLLAHRAPLDATLPDCIYSVLRVNGFIRPRSFDELSWIRRLHETTRAGSEGLGLGVVVTLACNFRCRYCYEQHVKASVSNDLEQAIVRFVDRTLNKRKRFRVAWFGGEPLLELSLIERLSRHFLDHTASRGITYGARISTNGYLLDESVAALLRDVGVDDIQVTIDGPPDAHNERRPLAGGGRSFDRVLESILVCSRVFPRTLVRINIDRYNGPQIPRLLKEYLYSLRNDIVVNFSVAASPYGPDAEPTWCTPPAEFSALEASLGQLADTLGFRVMRGYAFPCTSFCMGYQRNSFLIDPYGLVNRCPKYLGTKHLAYGELSSNGSIRVRGGPQAEWDNWSALDDSDCSRCSALPLCMGGCLLFLNSAKPKSETHRCFATHDMLKSLLRDSDLRALSGSAPIGGVVTAAGGELCRSTGRSK